MEGLDRPGIGLMAHLRDARYVIIVDAARAGGVPETVYRWSGVDIGSMRREEVVTTEGEAHMLALDRMRNKVYAFLPRPYRAAVFQRTA